MKRWWTWCTAWAVLTAAVACRGDWNIGVNGDAIRVAGDAIQGAGGTIAPDDISGLVLWLDASDAATFTLDGTAIQAWADKSGNGNDAVQHGDDTTRPTLTASGQNGLSVVTFDGLDYLQSGYAPTNASQSIIVAAKSTGAPNTFRSFCGSRTTISSGDRSFISYSDSANGVISAGVGAQSITTIKSTVTWTDYRIAELAFSTTSVALYNQGTNVYSGSISGVGSNSIPYLIGGLRQGTDYNATRWLGTACEILIYRNVLTPTERTNVVNYLSVKWGI